MTRPTDSNTRELVASIMSLDPKGKALAIAYLNELVAEQQHEQAQQERRG